MNVRRMCRIALMAALLCIAAPMSVPVGPIPITLATLVVYLAGICLGWAEGTAAVAIYILLGAVGLPVYSGFSGGFQKLFGVTGGYIVGYLFCAAAVGWAADRWGGWRIIPALVVGTALCYAVGTAWFMLQTQTPLAGALTSCVIPFLPGDAAKMAAAFVVGLPVRKRLDAVR